MKLVPILGGRAVGIDTGETGIPLVLLHAFPLDPSMWEAQATGLADKARVIAPAAPGFGGFTLDPIGWSVDSLADELADWFDSSGLGSVVLGGLSMGGYVALAFARRHPDRLRGLILADTKAEADTDEARSNRDRMIALVREQGTVALVAAMLPKLLSEQTRNDRPSVTEEVRRIAQRQPAEAVIAALRALRDRPNATPGLGAIHVPVLVIVGTDDAITPPAGARAMAADIPSATVAEIPGAGHLSNLEGPDGFNAAVVSFLKGL